MKTNAVNDIKKEMIFSELYSLLSSGLDFSHAFTMLIESEANKQVKKMLENIYRSVIKGSSLGKAFEDTGLFTVLDSGVITIGEETGKLKEALEFLAKYYSSKIAQRRMIIGAISYPMIIISVAVVVLIFMIMVIVPMFEQVYARMGGEMPSITQFIISISKNFHYFFFVFALIVLSIWIVIKFNGDNEKVQAITSNIILHTPIAGMYVRKSTQLRFCRLLYLLYSSGVPLLRGIDMLSRIIQFYPYRKSFEAICEGLNRGKSISDVMESFGAIYDRKLVVLLRVGEQTNRLGQMLEKQSEDIGQELNHNLKTIGSTLEPILILLVGVIVAIILIAMYMPMFSMGSVIN